MVNSKNKKIDTFAPGRCGFHRPASAPLETVPTKRENGRCGFQPHRIQSKPVGAVSNRTGLECLINSKVHHSRRDFRIPTPHFIRRIL